MNGPTFRSLFCARFGCRSSQYEEKVFKHCLYAHARLVAPIIRLVSRSFFDEDLRFINLLGAATSLRRACAESSNFREANEAHPSSFRMKLNLRVSGKKGRALAKELFAAVEEKGGAGAETRGGGSEAKTFAIQGSER